MRFFLSEIGMFHGLCLVSIGSFDGVATVVHGLPLPPPTTTVTSVELLNQAAPLYDSTLTHIVIMITL